MNFQIGDNVIVPIYGEGDYKGEVLDIINEEAVVVKTEHHLYPSVIRNPKELTLMCMKCPKCGKDTLREAKTSEEGFTGGLVHFICDNCGYKV